MTTVDPRRTLAAVCLVQFLVSLDLLVVNVALPRISADLGFDGDSISWVVHAYALTFGGLMLLGGKLADRFGHRTILIGGLLLFGIASLVAGLAQTAGQLVAARAAQGVGAAALQPASLAVLSATFPAGGARARAFAAWSAMNALGAALGVLLGGFLTEYAGWRSVMFINVPLVALALILGRRGLGATSPLSDGRRFDVLGAVLATGAMSLLVYGLVGTEDHAWSSVHTLTMFAASLLLLVAFVVTERRTRTDPLLRLGLVKIRTVAGANAVNLMIGAGMASVLFFMSLYVQDILGRSAMATGLMFFPFALGIIVGSVLSMRLDRRLSRRALIVVGCSLTAAGFFWFGFISVDGTFVGDILGPSIVASIGFGLCLGPVVSVGTVDVDRNESGSASSLLSSTRQIGGTLGLAALGAVARSATGGSPTRSGITAGYGAAMMVAAALLAAAAVTAWIMLAEREGRPDVVAPQADRVRGRDASRPVESSGRTDQAMTGSRSERGRFG